MSFVSIYRHVKCLKVFFFLKWGRGCRGGRRRVSQSAAKYTTAIALLGVISLKLINVGVLFRFLISDMSTEDPFGWVHFATRFQVCHCVNELGRYSTVIMICFEINMSQISFDSVAIFWFLVSSIFFKYVKATLLSICMWIEVELITIPRSSTSYEGVATHFFSFIKNRSSCNKSATVSRYIWTFSAVLPTKSISSR